MEFVYLTSLCSPQELLGKLTEKDTGLDVRSDDVACHIKVDADEFAL